MGSRFWLSQTQLQDRGPLIHFLDDTDLPYLIWQTLMQGEGLIYSTCRLHVHFSPLPLILQLVKIPSDYGKGHLFFWIHTCSFSKEIWVISQKNFDYFFPFGINFSIVSLYFYMDRVKQWGFYFKLLISSYYFSVIL